jgi:hypothetical protein
MAGPLVDDGAAAVGGAVELPNDEAAVVDAVLPLVPVVAAPNSPKLEVAGAVAASAKLNEGAAGVVAGVVAGGVDGGAVAAPPKLKVPEAEGAVAAGVVEDEVALEEEEEEETAALVEEAEEGVVLPPKLNDMLYRGRERRQEDTCLEGEVSTSGVEEQREKKRSPTPDQSYTLPPLHSSTQQRRRCLKRKWWPRCQVVLC